MKVPVKFPSGAELLVQSGQIVDFFTPFLMKKGKKTIRVPLAEILKFNPDKIFLFLKKVIGDTIKKGDLLAENKTFLSTKQYVSSVDGLIKEIDHITGIITIELDSGEQQSQLCFFTGEIEAIHDDHIELKVKRSQKFDINPTSHYLGAPVYYVMDVEKPLTEDRIQERFICGTQINPLEHSKLDTLGAKALITSSLQNIQTNIRNLVLQKQEDLEHLLKEQYPYCIIGIDGQSLYFYE